MRRRISWLVVATTSTVVVSFVVPLCLLVRTLAEDRAMAAADQEARNVAILVAGLDGEGRLPDLVDALDQRSPPTTDVLTASGEQIGTGPPMASDPDVVRALGGEGFTTVDGAGGRVLIPVVVPDGTAVVRTTVTNEQLHRRVLASWAAIVGLGIVLLAGGVTIAWRMGRRISEPLLEVAGAAHRLRAGDLSARAPVRGTPETEELGRALNGLAERILELLASERASVADLSHRLRTPVTALRLDTESVPDPEVRERLEEHITVLQRTVDAIVKEARRPVRQDLAPVCDAATTVRSRLEFWGALAEDQGRSLTVVIADPPVTVALAESDLIDVVDVLVDNVFAHTPEGTAFRVDLTAENHTCVLTIADAGAGPSGSSGPPGPPGSGERTGSTGLGLDIVRRTAHAAGGEVDVRRAPEGGMLVEVRLPQAE
jgi:signal transduction histidine kinase